LPLLSKLPQIAACDDMPKQEKNVNGEKQQLKLSQHEMICTKTLPKELVKCDKQQNSTFYNNLYNDI